jgi:hypothetical protein
MKTKTFCVALACAATIFTGYAQDFNFEASAISGGGGQSSSTDFELNATIGQVDAGSMSGGDFSLDGGFWSIIAAVDTQGAPKLTISASGNQVTISWPENSSAGFALEVASTSAISPGTANWTTVTAAPQTNNGIESVQLPLASGPQFYRLHKN